MSRLIRKYLPLIVVLCVVGFFVPRAIIARADDDIPARSVQRFVGQDDRGNSQAALEDALRQADAHYATQGADVLYEYRVRSTSGERGGFAFMNIVRVEIVTSAPF